MQLSEKAVRYGIIELTRRAGVEIHHLEGGALSIAGMRFFYLDPAHLDWNGPCICIAPCASNAWEILVDQQPDSLYWISKNQLIPLAADALGGMQVPVLFWGEKYKENQHPFVHISGQRIIFFADILSASIFMLSRWEESYLKTRDEHDRFPASASVAFKQKFLEYPVVDQYALILESYLREIRPSLKPAKRKFKVLLSHDIDKVREFSNPLSETKKAVRKLFVDKEAEEAFRIGSSVLKESICGSRSSFLQQIYILAELSATWGLESAFNLMASDKSALNSGYDPNWKPLQKCISRIRGYGFEIGFHPGYSATEDLKEFKVEKKRLEQSVSSRIEGGRNHYLRFDATFVWRHWENGGMKYDSTIGYADHEGFRCGTCYPYHPFNLETNQEFNLYEIPLIAMDSTLKNYRFLNHDEAKQKIMLLAERCRQVNGVFTLLWHNSSIKGAWEEWIIMYSQLIPLLAKMNNA